MLVHSFTIGIKVSSPKEKLDGWSEEFIKKTWRHEVKLLSNFHYTPPQGPSFDRGLSQAKTAAIDLQDDRSWLGIMRERGVLNLRGPGFQHFLYFLNIASFSRKPDHTLRETLLASAYFIYWRLREQATEFFRKEMLCPASPLSHCYQRDRAFNAPFHSIYIFPQ